MSLDEGNDGNATEHNESDGEEGTTTIVRAPASARTAQITKCSLRQCKNTDPSTHQVSCYYKDCGGKIHLPCYMAFLVKSNYQPLPTAKFCCGTK
jgi:hypothetical protein